jgi:drug/metabolite transporter (DMT)-like permease
VSRPSLIGALLVAGGAALFGTLSYIAHQAAVAGVDALSFVAWRGIVATVALVVLSLVLGTRVGGSSRYPDIRVLPDDRRIALVAAGVAGAVLNICLFAAYARTEIAIVLICYYSYPAIVTLAAVPLYDEHLSRIRVGALALACVGLVLVVLGPLVGSASASVVVDPLGVGLAFVAAVCQASFILISGRGWRPMPSLHVSTYVVAAIVVLSVPFALLAGDAASLAQPLSNHDGWIWILAGGITGAAVPTVAFMAGIGLIGPSRAAILMTFEALVGVSLAALLLGEQPTLLQVAGGAAVLFAAAVLQVAPRVPVALESEVAPVA